MACPECVRRVSAPFLQRRDLLNQSEAFCSHNRPPSHDFSNFLLCSNIFVALGNSHLFSAHVRLLLLSNIRAAGANLIRVSNGRADKTGNYPIFKKNSLCYVTCRSNLPAQECVINKYSWL